MKHSLAYGYQDDSIFHYKQIIIKTVKEDDLYGLLGLDFLRGRQTTLLIEKLLCQKIQNIVCSIWLPRTLVFIYYFPFFT